MKEKISIVSNLWIREVEMDKKGDIMEGHKHTFDHQHLLAVGSIRVITEGIDEPTDFHAPQVIFVPKDKMHSFEALTDKTLGYCIHPIRDGYRVEDIVCPTMKVTFKDFHMPEKSLAGLTMLAQPPTQSIQEYSKDEDSVICVSERSKKEVILTEPKPWLGGHEDDIANAS